MTIEMTRIDMIRRVTDYTLDIFNFCSSANQAAYVLGILGPKGVIEVFKFFANQYGLI